MCKKLSRLEVADVGFLIGGCDDIAGYLICRREEGLTLAFRLVDGLFLGSDRIFGGIDDEGIIYSRLLWRSEGCLVLSSVRLFVLDEADKVVNTFFVVVGDLIENLRDSLPHLDNVRVGRLADDGFIN